MILVDSFVWIDHFRGDETRLSPLLEKRDVLIHPHVVGELALGSLRQRDTILQSLRALPAANVAADEEVLAFIEHHRLFGRGIGFIDAHLLASAKLTPEAKLWTRDKRLAAIAADMRLSV